MRVLSITISILLSSIAYGQQLRFRGLLVDTILIRSKAGSCHLDEKRTITHRTDVYRIAFDKGTNKYTVTEFSVTNSKSTNRPPTLKQKEKHLTKFEGKVVNNTCLEGLLIALSNKYVKPTYDNIGLDKKKFLSLTHKKHIRNIAKLYKMDWNFKRRYSTREENNTIFDGCRNIDSFNLFLSYDFDTIGYRMIFDIWNEMWIFLRTTNKEFKFEGKYPNSVRQPWYEHSDTSIDFTSMVNLSSNISSIINLNINRFLVSILPNIFCGRNDLELRSLTNNYIKWYLKRRDILHDSY